MALAIPRSKEVAYLESNPKEVPLKAGEFVLGYPDELGGIQKNGTRRFSGKMEPMSFSGSCINGSRTSAST
jgi:hypothetical protein